ncbi:MAG: hypothetical protein JWL72_469 [Ilumatobacteraceae bacterium]|nr:hypothetical protein [Ilumatobacteraceae bacterium]
MITLVDRIVAVCASLDQAEIPWALGGALALAYATNEPRGTRDIDVNVFVSSANAPAVFAALPAGVEFSDADVARAVSDDQVRLFWDTTPIDVFFAAEQFHFEVGARCRTVPFEGRRIKVLAAEDLAVFKALFDRTKDWADIEAMSDSKAIDLDLAADRLANLLGDDERVARLRHALTPAARRGGLPRSSDVTH